MDRDDDTHVIRLGVVILAGHGGEELGLGGIDPLFAVAARDGGDFADVRQGGGGV